MKRIEIFLPFILSTVLLAQLPHPQPEPVDPKRAVVPEKVIDPAEEGALFKSMDDVLQFVSKDSGLPIRAQVKRELASRDQVARYIEDKMNEDEDEKRLERSEIVLKKFGLLPRDFALRSFMIALLREQVAGFYDSKQKTMFLLNWLPTESQKPVMSHELTHALQDQAVHLDDWLKDAKKHDPKDKNSDDAEIENDEVTSARSALVEGQGMAVMIDYYLKETQHSLADSPQVAEAIKGSMASPESGTSLLAHAPKMIQEALIFPYRDGLGFVQELLAAGGKTAAFSGALQRPPLSTHEILSPKSYLAHEHIPPVQLPDVEKILGKGWKRYDVGSMGQLDVLILLKQFADERAAREISPTWRGGAYYAFTRKSAVGPFMKTSDIALVYVSRWKDAETASRFAELYGASFKKRYKNAVLKSRDEGRWESEEGSLYVDAQGTEVLIMESVPEDVVAKLRRSAFSYKAAKAAVRYGDLTLRAVAPIFAATSATNGR